MAHSSGRLRGIFGLDTELTRRVVVMAVPVVLGMLTQTALNLVDTAFVGHLPPELSIPGVAALGIALKLMWAVGGFLNAIAIGTQAIVARRFGARDERAAGRVLTNSVVLGLVSSTVLSVAGWFAVPYVFPLINSDPMVVEVGVPYTQWRFIGIIAMVSTVSFKGFFDGIGRTYVHMVAAIVMNLVNLVLAYGLIFGRLGMPYLGVTGAGIAAVIATAVGMVVMAAWSLQRHYVSRFDHLKADNLNLRAVWEIVTLSVPTGVATVVVMSGFLIFDRIVATVDALNVEQTFPVYASATWIIVQVMSVTFMTCIAFGTATATLVSQSMGSGQHQLARRYCYEAVRIGVYFMGAAGLFGVFFPEALLGIFTDQQIVIEAGRTTMRITSAMQGVIAAAMIFMYALFGAGNTKLVMMVELALHFLVMLPVGWFLGVYLDLGMEGAFIGVFVYALLLAGILGYKFAEGRWLQISI